MALTFAEIGQRLGVSGTMASSYMRDRIGGFGGSYEEKERLVNLVADLAPCTANQIAARLGVAHASAHAALARAERDGFVQRVGKTRTSNGKGQHSILWDLAGERGRPVGEADRLVDAIAEIGPCTARQIAERLGLKHKSACAALRRAERSGFVMRVGKEPPRPGRSGPPGVLWDLA